jgi:hypothetical protein
MVDMETANHVDTFVKRFDLYLGPDLKCEGLCKADAMECRRAAWSVSIQHYHINLLENARIGDLIQENDVCMFLPVNGRTWSTRECATMPAEYMDTRVGSTPRLHMHLVRENVTELIAV